MDPFLRQLVRTLVQDASPLTRNKHFHTFDNKEGRQALRLSQRLLSLRRDLTQCHQQGGSIVINHDTAEDNRSFVVLKLRWQRNHRECKLWHDEFELLVEFSDVQETLSGLPTHHLNPGPTPR